MAGGKARKRTRKTSSQSKSPTQSQLLKRFKDQTADLSDEESEYQDAEDSVSSDTESQSVSSPKMADEDAKLAKALIRAFENPTVVDRLITALREEIHKSFKGELRTLKQKIRERDDRIQALEAKVEGLEMYGRRNGIRIHGIPETAGENTDSIVMGIAEEIEAGIPETALGRSHRLGRKVKGQTRPIIAKFVGHNYKVKFLRNKKKLHDSEIPGRADVYVNEDLTSKRAGWAKQARTWRRQKKVKDTWTRDGVLFIKVGSDSSEEGQDGAGPAPAPEGDDTREPPRIHRINSDRELCDFAISNELDLNDITIPSFYTVTTDEDDDE